jgi:hypothetical protein
MKKIFVWIPVALMLLAGCIKKTATSGVTGDCTWTLAGTKGNYTLTISGSGAMEDYESMQIDGIWQTAAPWNAYREDISTVVIQDSVSAVGASAFTGCSSLTGVTVGNSVETVGEGAFAHCSGLTGVTIPHSVTAIGKRAFYACSSLTGATVGNSVETVGEEAFAHCKNLTGVIIPHSVIVIGEGAFSGCSSLAVLTLGHSVTTVGKEAFAHCKNLTGVDIPSSVTIIGERAFVWCSNLSTVTNQRSTPQSINSNVFENAGISSGTLWVPAGSKAAYRATEGWKEFKHIVEVSE